MKRSELESILESKGLNKPVIPFFGGGVQVEINEGIASFRSINASALKHIQAQINEGGIINGNVLTYRMDEIAVRFVTKKMLEKNGCGYELHGDIFELKTQHGKNKWKIRAGQGTDIVEFIKNGKSVKQIMVSKSSQIEQAFLDLEINTFGDK